MRSRSSNVPTILCKPGLMLLADEAMSEADREKVQARIKTWLDDTIADKLKPLVEMARSTELQDLPAASPFSSRKASAR